MQSKYRVKLDKSGKSWVKKIFDLLGLLDLFKKGNEECTIDNYNVDFVISRNNALKGAFGIGVLIVDGRCNYWKSKHFC